MRSAALVLGLMAAVVASRTLKYAVPDNIQLAADCILPGSFEISDLEIYTDLEDDTKSTKSFHFVNQDTNIDTQCHQNSTSKPTSAGAAERWPCDDAKVQFIYQTTGLVGLTVIEKTCIGGTPSMEASGRIEPELTCQNATSSSTCTGKDSPVQGDFTSISPAPPSL